MKRSVKKISSWFEVPLASYEHYLISRQLNDVTGVIRKHVKTESHTLGKCEPTHCTVCRLY